MTYEHLIEEREHPKNQGKERKKETKKKKNREELNSSLRTYTQLHNIQKKSNTKEMSKQ